MSGSVQGLMGSGGGSLGMSALPPGGGWRCRQLGVRFKTVCHGLNRLVWQRESFFQQWLMLLFFSCFSSLGNIKLRWKLATTLIQENLHRRTLIQNNTFYWMHLCLKWFVPHCCRYVFYLLWEQESRAMAAGVVLKLPPRPPFSCFPMWTSNCLQASVCSCWTLAE